VDFTHYTDECVQAAADLVNTKGSTSGNEYMGTPEEARAFLEGHGYPGVRRISPADIAELHDVRERLRAVFHAEDEADAGARLNELLQALEVKPYLTDHDGHWHLHYAPMDAPIGRRVAAATAAALAIVVAEHGFNRLGICAADNCQDAFVDTSRNRSRRFCNDICSSRTNVAAYRARHKTKGSSPAT
jgi:predicted RNA-binding Zn ribbon-like protein